MSLDCSTTFARSRTNSARSSGESGCPSPGSGTPPLPAADILRRSWLTHLCNRFSCRFNSRATSVTDRFESITRCAASTRYSGVNDRRRPDIRTSFQGDHRPAISDVHYFWGTSQDRVIASIPRMPLITARYLAVLVDPATNKFQIDWQRSALVAGIAPAQFRSDEDGKTYDLTGRAEPVMEILRILRANQVPSDGSVDLRSNPAVRQQAMAVVRRAAASASTPAPPAAAPVVPVAPAAQRLQELERCMRWAPSPSRNTPPNALRSSPSCSRRTAGRELIERVPIRLLAWR